MTFRIVNTHLDYSPNEYEFPDGRVIYQPGPLKYTLTVNWSPATVDAGSLQRVADLISETDPEVEQVLRELVQFVPSIQELEDV